MKLEFTLDEAGYQKARMLKRLIALVDIYELKDSFDQDQLNALSKELLQIMGQPGFDAWRDEDFGDIIKPGPHSLKDVLRNIFGPSRQEINLSKQREILIERAEHAEASAFEALAELADAAKQRDEALARIRDLEAELGRQNPA
ncbi:MAG: hypothetical protein MI673_09135 [Thiotrichales bacterium]|nr:hypothetical protein [Thiotrichales bacterium]